MRVEIWHSNYGESRKLWEGETPWRPMVDDHVEINDTGYSIYYVGWSINTSSIMEDQVIIVRVR